MQKGKRRELRKIKTLDECECAIVLDGNDQDLVYIVYSIPGHLDTCCRSLRNCSTHPFLGDAPH